MPFHPEKLGVGAIDAVEGARVRHPVNPNYGHDSRSRDYAVLNFGSYCRGLIETEGCASADDPETLASKRSTQKAPVDPQ